MPKHLWLLALAVALFASAPAHADPISGAIAAVTAVGGAISSMGAVGTFLVNGALAVGASYLSRAFAKKTSKSSASSNAVTLEMSLDADHPRQLVLGARVVGGSLHYRCKYGPQNENIDLIIVLADHEIDSLQKVWVNGTGIAMHLDEFGYQDVPEFADKYGVSMLSFRLYKGGVDQPADTEVIGDSGGQWTADHRLRGCAWVKVRIVFNPEVWGSSLPTFKWLINGAKLYDPRLDSTMPGGSGPMRWGQPETYLLSDNLELARYNFLRGIYVGGDKWFGVGLDASEIPLDQTHAAIAACAEPVLTRAGTYEPRYRVAAVIDADEDWRDVLAKFSQACTGNLPDLSGRYALLPGVAQVPVLSITDDDFIADAELTGSRHRPFDEVVCEVTGSWASPEALYEITALPTRYSSADEEADGGFRRSASLDLSYVASQSQGQRCMEITRRLARRQITHKGTLRRRFDVLQAGDWIYWTSAKYGYSARVFRVEAVDPNDDMSVTVQLREIDSGVYGWSVDDEQDPNHPTDLPSGGAGSAVVVNVAVAIAQVNSIDGTQVPGIRVTWNPITDPTVYALVIEYRRVGDAPWQTYVASEPQVREGAATITAGIIGGDFYQARITPLTSPPRVVDVSATATTSSSTVEVIVNRAQVATVTEAVRPGVITNDALEAELRGVFDTARYANIDAMTIGLLLAAANTAAEKDLAAKASNALRADVALGLNPISAGIERIDQKAAEITAAFAQADVAITAQIAGVAAALQTEESSRVTAVSAVAQSVSNLSAQLGSDIAGVQQQITAQSEAGNLLASQTTSLFVQDIQGDDAALVAQMVEMAARGEDTTDLRRKNNVAVAGISEVRSATVTNGAAIASVKTDLVTEIGARAASISSEISARTSADEALAHQITTLVAQEASDRGAVVQEERTARISGDTALSSQITTLVALESSERQAAVVTEQQARVNADSALSSSINYVNARVNGVDAGGSFGIAAVSGVSGAAVSYRISLNAGAVPAAFRLDAMSGGTSRAVFDVSAFYLESPAVAGGYPVSIFSAEAGLFTLNGNVRINGNLVVGGTITAAQISEGAGLSDMAGAGGSVNIDSTSSDWQDVGSLTVNVATRGGYMKAVVFVKAVATATNAGTQAGIASAGMRVLANDGEIYYSGLFNQAISGQQSRDGSQNDFFPVNLPGGYQTFRVQVSYAYSGGIVGYVFAKIGVITVNR